MGGRGRRLAIRGVHEDPIGQLLDGKLADKGIVSLGFMELGGRHVTNSKRPIRTLEDLKGLKIRMQPNETHLATFRALGANPVAMDIKELYSALQQGVVDGQENPFSVIRASRYFEVQKFVTNTGHFFDFINVVANKRAYDTLPPAQQKQLRASMAKAIAWQRERATTEETESIAEIMVSRSGEPPEKANEVRETILRHASRIKNQIGDDG